ncbi:FMN-binding negative transcriptional regulator [Streptomyces sp. NPDC056121]|uniref:FMN-binding negative transcriptional regulator n=1 Tax=unclassified Streptomyces TaxID=2593676 RepID=UPI0030C9231A
MYVPKGYRPQDPSWAIDAVRSNPLAVLVSSGDGSPYATHLPVILDTSTLDAGTGETGLEGVTFLGHLNRQNPHWNHLASGQRALLIFQGPHSYITPSVYEVSPAAPTWNFVSVHAQGSLEVIDDPAGTLDIIKATVAAYESDFGSDWDMTHSLDYFDELLPGVGAFRLKADSVQGMFKLSQEKTPEVRSRVVHALDASGSTTKQTLAATMREYT